LLFLCRSGGDNTPFRRSGQSRRARLSTAIATVGAAGSPMAGTPAFCSPKIHSGMVCNRMLAQRTSAAAETTGVSC
jgi:hypothetical protein